MTNFILLLLFVRIISVECKPTLDPTALMRETLIPADAPMNSIIYRLRASDTRSLYPMTFTLKNESASTAVSIENLNCSILNSLCQANVILRKTLEIGRYYDFVLLVTNRKGESASALCSFRATNATTPLADIFPGAPPLLMVSEEARRNSDLGSFLVRGNKNRTKGVVLELWGSQEFGLYQKLINDRDAQGTIRLVKNLDYETRTVHHLTILANDPYSEMDKDTRNIASWSLLVAVLDEQDTPPVFTLAPPTTTLSPSLRPGDLVLRVHAEDGDRGKPRDVRYGLVPEGNSFTTFFDMSEETGELRLARPLSDILSISHSGHPILLTVIAEEVRSDPLGTPSQSSTVRIALIPPGIKSGTPTFAVKEYNTLLDENSPSGTVLELAQPEIITEPGDLVTLELENNNGTFEIAPNVVDIKGHTKFQIKVHDSKLLDYEERKTVECSIIAKEVSGNFTTKAKLIVILNDINDNSPEFTQKEYEGFVQENANVGTSVLRVEAEDVDREPGSKIKYTKLYGAGSEFFDLNSTYGIISVRRSEGLDAEKYASLNFFVEAADENGEGKSTSAAVLINLMDVNDEAPQFDKDLYEFIIAEDGGAFTTRAIIHARDQDLTAPNNEVHYELITPLQYSKIIRIDEKSGELFTGGKIDDLSNEPIILKARAWDGGIPRLFNECTIKIYSPESNQIRRMLFIVAGSNPDRKELKDTLSALTGGDVIIDDIRPFSGYEPGATDLSKNSNNNEGKSVVVTRVNYKRTGGVVDINRIQNILENKEIKTSTTNTRTEIIRKSEYNGGGLWWLFIVLILLALLAALVLILCCICQGCPLYVPPKKIHKTEKLISQQVVKGSGLGRESKSVQVAEWFGRKEAWTPEHHNNLIDTEIDSLRRHELERNSDNNVERVRIQRQQPVFQREPSREQLYIREGNADILRLVTRGNEHHQQSMQRPVTLMGDQINNDYHGKDILMRRYIDQQSQVLLPNAVNKLQAEHELLEASLRQQNALLRQILLERERDLRLETQSLPAGTQTDNDAETQTESQYLLKSRRRARSDNDASDGSDDDFYLRKNYYKRRKSSKNHHNVRRKIKTPIQEELSDDVEVVVEKVKKSRPAIKQTRTSELRQKRVSSNQDRSRTKSSTIRKEVLREISASLEQSDSDDDSDGRLQETVIYKKPNKKRRKVVEVVEYFSDSLDNDEISPRSDKIEKLVHHRSESDLVYPSSIVSESNLAKVGKSVAAVSNKSQSQSDLTKVIPTVRNKEELVLGDKKPVKKKTARYMEWYNKSKKEVASKTKTTSDNKSSKLEKKPKVGSTVPNKAKSQQAKSPEKPLPENTEIKEDEVVKEIVKMTEKVDGGGGLGGGDKKNGQGPDHPLLQHSEHRFEVQYPNVAGRRTMETNTNATEDTDSGIALSKPAMAQKKSVFTIAYDDMHTSQIRPESTSPN